LDLALKTCRLELAKIGSELEKWAESLPNNMQKSERHNLIVEAASTLESAAERLLLKDMPNANISVPGFSFLRRFPSGRRPHPGHSEETRRVDFRFACLRIATPLRGSDEDAAGA
jgi:hypothetical protein